MSVVLRPSLLVIIQGATFNASFFYRENDKVTPINLGTLQARLRIAPRFDSPTSTFVLTSSPAAGLTLDPANGAILARISALLTQPLNANVPMLYDLELYDPLDLTNVNRLISGGQIEVRAAVP